jgi:hypothetical protein
MHGPRLARCTPGVVAWLLFELLAAPAPCLAQGTGGPQVSGSRVGYIDIAIPADLFRFRYDSNYGNNRPTRAEFFWPRAGAPDAPGPPGREFNVDYQEFWLYLEKAVDERFSAFVELPFRAVNPAVDPNAGGVGDLNAGLKYAFLYSDDLVASFQFRTYVPTGDGRLGLGTRHVSLEPALLVWKPLTEDFLLEGEVRAWVPAGEARAAGPVLRYGLGLSYNLGGEDLWVAPVAEVVGWTALDGKVTDVQPTGSSVVRNADGDTIVNLKLGLRVGMTQRTGFYAGYGRALTGDRWYQDTFRVEFRLAY